MYVIRYCDGIYAGIWSDMDGNYCYSSNSNNKYKPKTFKTYAGVKKHLEKLKIKVPFPDNHNFIIEEWSDMDLQLFLDEIGVTIKSKEKTYVDPRIKYWRKVFKPVKGEIEVIQIEIKGNIGTVTYLMPYSTIQEEFFFDIGLSKEEVIESFCDAVEERASEMILIIKECSKDVRNLF